MKTRILFHVLHSVFLHLNYSLANLTHYFYNQNRYEHVFSALSDYRLNTPSSELTFAFIIRSVSLLQETCVAQNNHCFFILSDIRESPVKSVPLQ
jgi:hypothetical protein